MGLYQRIAALLPKSVTEAFQRELNYVGIQVSEKKFVGFIILFGLGIAIAAAVNFYIFFKFNPLLAFLAVFGAFCGGVYFWLSTTADKEGKAVERILPDVLELIASNIKAGITTERALFASARPEFGALSAELKEASKEIMSGERMEVALMDLPKRIKSKVFERSIWLIVQGIKSGGEIANLLIQLASDLREENAMRDEISANISMYVILIFATAVLGAPLLFGISSIIVGILVEQTSQISISPQEMEEYTAMSPVGRFIGMPTVNITEAFIVSFSVIALIITGIFASLTTGAMAEGSEKAGVKYMPMLIIGAVVLFFVVRFAVEMLLQSVPGMF